MQKKAFALMSALLLALFMVGTSGAWGSEAFTLGVRGGVSDDRPEEDFNQYELFGSYQLPWRWSWPSGWVLETELDAAAGALRGGGETEIVLSAGPGLSLRLADRPFTINAAVCLTYLSEHGFGKEDFGGPIQFTSSIGITVSLPANFGVGYRLQHMSNAGLYDENPGLNMHMLELEYRF